MQMSARRAFGTCSGVIAVVCLFVFSQTGTPKLMSSIRKPSNTTSPESTTMANSYTPMDQDRMTERLHTKTLACKKLKDDKLVKLIKKKNRRYDPIIVYSADHNLSYCGVGKVGGTFIKQLFSELIHGVNQTMKLENIARLKVHQELDRYIKVKYQSEDWKHARLITVGRDPYTRLFSAYIDRIFPPSITMPIRKEATCRFNVTFEEYLGIVINNTKKAEMDPHWSPINYICNPCNVTSTFIVKQETFTNDMQFVVEQLGLPENIRKDIDRKLKKARVTWTINGVIKEQMEAAKTTVTKPGCIGWFGAIKRIWRAFQVQGYINENIDFPTSLYNETNDFSNVDLLLKTVFDTINKDPMSGEKRKAQRRKHLVNAYKNINTQIIDDIKRVFKPDFDMFGYSNEPPR